MRNVMKFQYFCHNTMVIVSVTTSVYISALFDLFISDLCADLCIFESFSLELTGGGGLESHDLTPQSLKSQILGLETCIKNIRKRLDIHDLRLDSDLSKMTRNTLSFIQQIPNISAHRRIHWWTWLSNAPVCFHVSAQWRVWCEYQCSQSQSYLLSAWIQWPISAL